MCPSNRHLPWPTRNLPALTRCKRHPQAHSNSPRFRPIQGGRKKRPGLLRQAPPALEATVASLQDAVLRADALATNQP